MPRPRKTNELTFFQNDRLEIQYAQKCLVCQNDCKQSFRAEIVKCRRCQPIPKPKRTRRTKK